MKKARRFVLVSGLAAVSLGILQAAPIGGPARAGDFGVGVQLGVPVGVTVKYWMDSRLAIQTALGSWSDDFTATADIVWHDPFAFRNGGRSDVPGFYLGGGLYVSEDNEDELGLRGVLGINYFFPDNPFEVYAELAPTLILEDDTEGDLTGGVGARYYFR